jgi:hypothetical protein
MSVQDKDGSVLVRQSRSRSRNVPDHSMVSVSITSVRQVHLLADGDMAYMYTLPFFYDVQVFQCIDSQNYNSGAIRSFTMYFANISYF